MRYGYVRVSTKEQRIDRQIKTLKERFGNDIIIYSEAFTGKTMNRPQWQKLIAKVEAGDVIVFDEISRMSRNAAEGFETYKALMDKGVDLEFIKESPLNTQCFKSTLQVAMTGTDADCILRGVNQYLMILAEKQIQVAFETAEKELQYRETRQREGIAVERERRLAEGKPMWGAVKGQTPKKVEDRQVKQIEKIKKYSRRYEGSMNDNEVMKLVEISRGTFYKLIKIVEEN